MYVCVFAHVGQVRALSVEFHAEAAVRLRRSRGGEQHGQKRTSPPPIFPQARFFPLSSELHKLNRSRHIPRCLSEGREHSLVFGTECEV